MKKIYCLAIFLVLFLVSCGGDPPVASSCPDTARTLDEFFCKVREFGGDEVTLRGALEKESFPNDLEDPENCPANSFTIPQDGKIKGSTGGLARSTGSTPRSLIAGISELVNSDYVNNTAILIVDDFQFESSDNDNLLLTPSIDWFIGEGEFTVSIDVDEDKLASAARIANQEISSLQREEALYDINVTHGSIVALHTLNLLEAVPNLGLFNLRRGAPNSDLSVVFIDFFGVGPFELSQSFVTVALIDTDGLNTNTIASAVRTGVDAVFDYNENVERNAPQGIAINMSFVLLPCALRDSFREAQENGVFGEPIATIDDYAAAFVKQANVSGNDAVTLQQDFLSVIFNASNDPNDVTRNLSLQERGIPYAFVASAGNFAYNFPFYPGAWQRFISVSATPGYDGSNSGEISAGGNVFLVGNVSAEGTSYAAPLVSVFAAVDMTRSTPLCTYNSPELDHWDTGTSPDNPVGFQVNFPLNTAVRTICSN